MSPAGHFADIALGPHVFPRKAPEPETVFESGHVPPQLMDQWDELDIHLVLDEVTHGSEDTGYARAAWAAAASQLNPGSSKARSAVAPAESGGLSSSSSHGKHKRGPRPRLFKKNSCQADNCSEDLSSYSFYYQRNHICPMHLKSSSYVVRGVATRFCQRCGVGHVVEEFSGGKRSCKKALERHNQRRREKVGGTGASSGSSSAAVPSEPGLVDWEVNSRPNASLYEQAEPWSLSVDVLSTLGINANEGLYLPAMQGDVPSLVAGRPGQDHAGAAPVSPRVPALDARHFQVPPPDASGPSAAETWMRYSALTAIAPAYPGQMEPQSSVTTGMAPVPMSWPMPSMEPMPADQLSWLASQL